MQWKEIEKIIGENEKYTRMLEYYESTGRMPTRKVPRTFTISQSSFDTLKSESRKTGKTMSALLDELIEKNFGT
jgi:hypothetical protein